MGLGWDSGNGDRDCSLFSLFFSVDASLVLMAWSVVWSMLLEFAALLTCIPWPLSAPLFRSLASGLHFFDIR